MCYRGLHFTERKFFTTAVVGAHKNGDQPELRERTITTASSQRDQNCKGHFHVADHITPEMPYKFYLKQVFNPPVPLKNSLQTGEVQKNSFFQCLANSKFCASLDYCWYIQSDLSFLEGKITYNNE